jgi:short-subunit dehydrogenase
MPRQIENMIVVITGASAGIGRELAKQLAARRAKLVLSARRLDRLEALSESLGGGHLCVRADVAVPADCEALVAQAIARFGRIDTLVCNAGYGIVKGVVDTSVDEMRDIFATNVFGTTDCIRAAVPHLRRQVVRDEWRGQIVIVSSAAGRRGLPYFGAYAATKAAQLSIAEALRVELRDERIAVTSVHPVGTETDFFTTAGQKGATMMPPPGTGEVRQSARTVAKAMVGGIVKPRPEVWPLRPSRWALSLATLMPGVVDHVMAKYRGQIRRLNQSKPQ